MAAKRSSPRKARRRGSGSKSSATARLKAAKGNAQQPARGDSPVAKLLENVHDRLVAMSEVVDVVQSALQEGNGDGALIVGSASSVLYNCVLTPMQDEIRWLDSLIPKIRKGNMS